MLVRNNRVIEGKVTDIQHVVRTSNYCRAGSCMMVKNEKESKLSRWEEVDVVVV